MNEATFEAVLNGVLRKLFPTLDEVRITHQTSFTLRFGHHRVNVDGKLKELARGRLDALVSVDSRPALLIELKAPGVPLTTDDEKQALSYARLCDPMPPLFVVSNGDETRLFKTIDHSPLNRVTLETEQITALLQDAMACAAEDQDRAIRLLLGRNPDLWRQIVVDESVYALAQLTGRPADFSRPLVRDFAIKRAAAEEISSLLSSGSRAVVLTGVPLSGKTNVLAQFSTNSTKHIIPLFVDASSLGYGVWQHIANVFTGRLFRATSAEEARNWLSLSLRHATDIKIAIVIDGWVPKDDDAVRAAVDEIVTLTDGGGVRLVLALDPNHFERLKRVPGRPSATALGRYAAEVKLKPLDDVEFENASELLWQRFRATFYPGALHNRELRSPSLLRLTAAALTEVKVGPKPDRADQAEIFIALEPITGTRFLQEAWQRFVTDLDLRNDLEKLAQAFIDAPERKTYEWIEAFEQFSRSVLPLDYAEQVLGTDRISRLKTLGFVGVIDQLPTGFLLLSKLPELLTVAASRVIARQFTQDNDASYSAFLHAIQEFPLSDIVGAGAIMLISSRDPELAGSLIGRLLSDEPSETVYGEGQRFSLLTADGPIRIMFGEGMNERMVQNLCPFLVLSQIAALPMEALSLDQDDGPVSGNARLFATVGDSPYLLRRIDTVRLQDMRPFQTHELPSGEEVICHHEGLIEPITLAMLYQLLRDPKEMDELIEWAIKESRSFLVWRLLSAATYATSITDSAIADAASKIVGKGRAYWRTKFGYDATHEESRDATSSTDSQVVETPLARAEPSKHRIANKTDSKKKNKRKESKRSRKKNAKKRNSKFH